LSVKKFAKKEIVQMLSGRRGGGTRARLGPIEGLINLGAGDPDFNQPELINKAVYEAMKAGQTHYSFGGEPDFKEAIAEYYKKYGVTVDPASQVLVTSGGSQAIFQAFGAILNPGDELLIMDPAYGGYTGPTAYFGTKMTRAKLTKDDKGIFRPDMENIKAAITDKTKALLICNPDNPVGTVYTADELKGIAEIAVDKDIVVIADEIYTEFVWGGAKHRPIINLPDMWERTLVLMSFSKTFAWTGCRAGYIIAGPEMMGAVGAVPTGICGVPVPFQKAGALALKEGWDFVDMMRKEYKKRIDFMAPRLNEIDGITCPYPEGAFYLFPDISEIGMPSAQFAMEMFQKTKVRGASGSGYGENGEGHMRFALVKPVEVLADACDRIEEFVKSLPPKAPRAYP
jgi:aminotransferase